MLRAKKKGLETWDELMCRLGRRRRYEIECTMCGKFIGTTDMSISPEKLAKENGWRELYTGKVQLDRDGVKTKVELGYVCCDCWEEYEEERGEIEETEG
jgi:DNA-directed RNA polymerase subunit RPC12/RpoP